MKIQRSLAKKRGNIRKTSEITFLFGSVFLSVIFAFSGIYFLFGKPCGMFSPRGGNAERICAEACGGIGREEKFPSCVRVCGIDVGGTLVSGRIRETGALRAAAADLLRYAGGRVVPSPLRFPFVRD